MDQQAPASNEWTVLRCGVAGIAGLGMICGVRLVISIPWLFIETERWRELLVFPLQVIVLGFLSGAACGIVLPLARLGRWGDAAIGAVCANVYLLVCFALFETDALFHPRLDTALALSAIASLGGIGMGLSIGNDVRRSTFEGANSQGDSPAPPA